PCVPLAPKTTSPMSAGSRNSYGTPTASPTRWPHTAPASREAGPGGSRSPRGWLVGSIERLRPWLGVATSYPREGASGAALLSCRRGRFLDPWRRGWTAAGRLLARSDRLPGCVGAPEAPRGRTQRGRTAG